MALTDMFTAGHARGERERAKRTDNQNRNIATKKQVRLAWENQIAANKEAIASLAILKRNTNKYLDREDEIRAQDWALGRENDLELFDDQIAAYQTSVEEFDEALEFINISNNVALKEQSNYMQDFYTKMQYDAIDAQYALDDTMTKANFEMQTAQLNVQTAMNRGASNREMLKLQNEAERATSAHESQQENVKAMQEEGKVLARGGAGRSSRKAVQSVGAGLGMQQAMRVDALLNKNSAFRNQIQASHDETYYQKVGFNTRVSSINAGVKNAQRDYGLSQDQARATLQSGLAANETKLAQIAASKYSQERIARSKVLDIPKPPKMEPIPWKAIRPEWQEVKKLTQKDKEKFYDTHMSTLEDENKIVGYEGRTPGWMTALQIGEQVATAAVAGFAGAPTAGPHAGSFSWMHAAGSLGGFPVPNSSGSSNQNPGLSTFDAWKPYTDN